MTNNSGETNAFLLGFKSVYRAYKWAIGKPSLLILSILLVVLQLVQAVFATLAIEPANFLTHIGLLINSNYLGLLRSVSILLFALVTYAILAIIQTIGTVTIALINGHKPYVRHDLVASFSKVIYLGWYIPLYMGIILGLIYVPSFFSHTFILNLFWLLLNVVLTIFVAYSIFIITFRQTSPEFAFRQALKDLVKNSAENLGAISIYFIGFAGLSFMNFFTNSFLAYINVGFLPKIILSILLIVFFSVLSVIVLFFIPAYIIYAAFFYNQLHGQTLENKHV